MSKTVCPVVITALVAAAATPAVAQNSPRKSICREVVRGGKSYQKCTIHEWRDGDWRDTGIAAAPPAPPPPPMLRIPPAAPVAPPAPPPRLRIPPAAPVAPPPPPALRIPSAAPVAPPAPPSLRSAPPGTPANPITTTPVAGTLVQRFDEIIAYDSQQWFWHRYAKGSVRNARYLSGSLDAQTFVIRADYDYYENGLKRTGWAKIDVRNGKLYCIEYWNSACRAANYSGSGIDRYRMPGDRRE